MKDKIRVIQTKALKPRAKQIVLILRLSKTKNLEGGK